MIKPMNKDHVNGILLIYQYAIFFLKKLINLT